jgi:hypothetical protein
MNHPIALVIITCGTPLLAIKNILVTISGISITLLTTKDYMSMMQARS